MAKQRKVIRSLVGLFCISCLAQSALADGYFLQADAGSETRSVVAAATTGPLNFGFNLSDYEGGLAVSTSFTYGLPLGEVAVLKIGPSIGVLRENGTWQNPELGAKLSLDRYAATSFGSVYGLAELNSIDTAWFFLAQLTLQQPGVSFELSRGGSDSYRETTVVVQKKLSDRQMSLRLGYKLSSKEVFIGFNINTF